MNLIQNILWNVHVSFYIQKYDPVRYRNRTFQKFESVLYWITMFTYEAN